MFLTQAGSHGQSGPRFPFPAESGNGGSRFPIPAESGVGSRFPIPAESGIGDSLPRFPPKSGIGGTGIGDSDFRVCQWCGGMRRSWDDSESHLQSGNRPRMQARVHSRHNATGSSPLALALASGSHWQDDARARLPVNRRFIAGRMLPRSTLKLPLVVAGALAGSLEIHITRACSPGMKCPPRPASRWHARGCPWAAEHWQPLTTVDGDNQLAREVS